MKKKKSGKIISKILKILWFVLGGIIIIWTFAWGAKTETINDFGVIVTGIMFGIGIYALIIYGAITVLFILIKWIIKKCKKKKF